MIWQILAAILHLGNVEFEKRDGTESCSVKQSPSIDHVCELLQVDQSLLSRWLVAREITVQEGKILKPIRHDEVKVLIFWFLSSRIMVLFAQNGTIC